MKRFIIIESYSTREHEQKISENLNEGWEVVGSGHNILVERNERIYWTHLIKDVTELISPEGAYL